MSRTPLHREDLEEQHILEKLSNNLCVYFHLYIIQKSITCLQGFVMYKAYCITRNVQRINIEKCLLFACFVIQCFMFFKSFCFLNKYH
jgi:hypothetical protein